MTDSFDDETFAYYFDSFMDVKIHIEDARFSQKTQIYFHKIRLLSRYLENQNRESLRRENYFHMQVSNLQI